MWWPDPADTAFWPAGIPREETVPAFVAAFAAVGFAPTDSADAVAGVEKVAVYARNGLPTHMARQLPSGRWTSELGVGPDIEHLPADLAGDVYGDVVVLMQRPRPNAS